MTQRSEYRPLRSHQKVEGGDNDVTILDEWEITPGQLTRTYALCSIKWWRKEQDPTQWAFNLLIFWEKHF